MQFAEIHDTYENNKLMMPPIKIDYVVSFSSEDPENPASNLLVPDVKSKWLCNKGEPSCSVVLQLKSASKIDTITIGAYHVALIEVLVGLSEKPSDPFEVLVPSCVLQAAGAARRGDAPECVRTFGAAQLAGAARGRRWDRLRLVCSQPYNKHCKYGLAFVHVAGPESAAAGAARTPSPDRGSSDDEFRPGELFARHCSRDRQSTDSQIRQASSQALKNIADTSFKLIKTPITKTGHKERKDVDEQHSDRKKESLMYSDDDTRPHARIDRIVQRHNDLKQKETSTMPATVAGPKTLQHDDRTNTGTNQKKEKSKDDCDGDKANDNSRKRSADEEHKCSKVGRNNKNKTPRKDNDYNNDSQKGSTSKKRKRLDETSEERSPGPACGALHEVLAGVVLALSGYVDPRRAALRGAALVLGAQYRRDWQPDCTHLICAFPNTPKLRAARAARPDVPAITGEWLERCVRARRRLPWRWFATEPELRLPAPALSSDEDTDDEIERVLRDREQRKRAATGSPPAGDAGPQGSDTEPDEPPERQAIDPEKQLPHFWAGYTFAVSGRLRALLARHIRAYGGLVLQPWEVRPDSSVQYAVGAAAAAAAGAVRVRPAWVWRAHRRRRHAEPEPHELEPAD